LISVGNKIDIDFSGNIIIENGTIYNAILKYALLKNLKISGS
jgi:hypothetical protein